MSKTNRPNLKRNNVAMGMIIAGTGKAQIFKDRRDKRAKDARKVREAFEY